MSASRGLAGVLALLLAVLPGCGKGGVAPGVAPAFALEVGEVELVIELPPAPPGGARTSLKDLDVRVTNTSAGRIRILRPGDGSLAGWRTPAIGWSALPVDSTAPRPAAPPAPAVPWCGLMNPITRDEVVVLDPGESTLLGPWVRPPRLGPGTHRIAFHYRNDPALESAGPLRSQYDNEGTRHLLRASTRCEAWSPEVVVTLGP